MEERRGGGKGGRKRKGRNGIKNCIRKVERANSDGKGAAIAHEVSGRVFASSLPPEFAARIAANVASNLRFCASRHSTSADLSVSFLISFSLSLSLSMANLDFCIGELFPDRSSRRSVRRVEVSFAE